MAEAQTVTNVAPGPKPFSVPTVNVDLSQESAIRAIANAAESAGDQTGDSVVTVPEKGVAQTPSVQATLPNPNALVAPVATQALAPETPTPQVQLAPPGTPEKFLKPDGTVDEEKLLASSKQLDAALEQKTLTVEEMVAQYKDKENKLRNLPNPNNPESVARFAQAQVQAPPPMQPQVQMPHAQLTPDQATLQAQIMADLNRDPIGTIVDIVKSVTSTENKPLHEFVTSIKEQQKDQGMKNNLMQLVKEDPRVANPAVYQAVLSEIESDPGYRQLKNPYKAAWNEVKARLRLGDTQTPAQPSKTASPILGGGTPPPVPSMAGSYSPQTIGAAIGQAKGKDEMAAIEAELRRLSIASGF